MDKESIPNVLFVIGNFRHDSGGAQRLVAIQTSDAFPHRVRYSVAYFFGEGTMQNELPDDITVIALSRRPWKILSGIIDLRARLKAGEFDIVHTMSNVSGIAGRIAAYRCPRVKVLSAEHNNHSRSRNLSGWLNACTLPLADMIVCGSHSVGESFGKITRWITRDQNKAVIHNTINLEGWTSKTEFASRSVREELGFPKDCLLLGNFARVDSQKNQRFLVAEMREVIQHCPNARLVLVGHGFDTELGVQIVDDIRRHELNDYVKVHEAVDLETLRHWYRQLDLFVFPSRYEGFSLGLLEAMAAGCAIVASDIPEIVEAVDETAVRIDPTKSDSLARGIISLLKDEERRRELGVSAHERYNQEFSAARMIQLYEDVYHSMLTKETQ